LLDLEGLFLKEGNDKKGRKGKGTGKKTREGRDGRGEKGKYREFCLTRF